VQLLGELHVTQLKNRFYQELTVEKFRAIENKYQGSPFNMVGDGFRVMNFFPNGNALAERLNPFILLDYNPAHYFSATNTPRGVGAHPHRGFETVAIAYQGVVAHHDSAGNQGVIEAGDVQWMTAGQGVLHKEYHEKAFASQGGILQMVQLWVNLPKQFKMTKPRYQTLTKQKMKSCVLTNQQGTVKVIAGDYAGIKGLASTFTPIHLFDINLNAEGELALNMPAHFNTALLILEGEITLNQSFPAKQNELIVFKNAEGTILINNSKSQATLLLLSAEPLNEPIAHYGPFVMNTEAELKQAILDFNSGKFGYL
jgi:redox-sensitive bicupin YhaK (pirin superfamily)